jgi:hypothetical protein
MKHWMRKMLECVDAIIAPGFLGGGHQMATDSKGNPYLAARNRRMQALAFKGMAPAIQQPIR